MSTLRVRVSLADAPVWCQWSLDDGVGAAVGGEGTVGQLPRRAEHVQLLIPAAQMRIVRARLPGSARRHAGLVLAYAVEEQTVGEPDATQVSWLGRAGDADLLAAVDKEGLKRWLDALHANRIRTPEVQCETLLLPRAHDEWSMAWDGREGFVRTARFEGAATDCGTRAHPPLSLRLMLDEARIRGERPAAIALHVCAPQAQPDLDAWQRELGITVRLAGSWDWRTAPWEAGVSLARKRWRLAPGALARLRPAAWIAGAALLIHAVALITDWALLAGEQRTLRQGMVARFRATFPDAIAVVDPTLQMRRKVTDARHAAGQADRSDFLPMIERVAIATSELPAGAVRNVSYEEGRMTVELSAVDSAIVQRIVTRLREAGLRADVPAAPGPGPKTILTVRAA